jgi:hypothetical protein
VEKNTENEATKLAIGHLKETHLYFVEEVDRDKDRNDGEREQTKSVSDHKVVEFIMESAAQMMVFDEMDMG